MTKEAVRAVFTKAITEQAFREKFENPATREQILRRYNILWQAYGGLSDDELDILVQSTATKISDISVDFDSKAYYED
jgi:hypothetical protein